VTGIGCSHRIICSISGRHGFGKGGDRCVEVTRIIQCGGECTEQVSFDRIVNVGFASCPHIAGGCQRTSQHISGSYGLLGIDESGCQPGSCHDNGALLTKFFESIKGFTEGHQRVVLAPQTHQCGTEHLARPGGQREVVFTIAQEKQCGTHGLVVTAVVNEECGLFVARLQPI